MNTHLKTKHVEWLNAEEMHKHTQDWLSELEFVKDEHIFFEDLVKTHTLQIIDTKKFSKYQEIIETIKHFEKRNNSLIKAIKVHGNALKIMVDDVNQPKEEKVYKKEHENLIIQVSEFLKDYQSLKSQLFTEVKNILKKEKQQRLLKK
ncbi:hypothetical protein CJ739_3221 [Mariniflexile rhizosphaerae]|uniref:hypothetical protein n=1 Tax=unclassified Mariniflexile TaxID=2643887 RepID=UPI000CB632E4|nr:hypothetical protein [Mariniflexile sp. TRM1-10]AXP82283.1 hypothetical protein CJ739_3221 [Mariniflexile sp. TRM1-10]PLB20381.1 MAG: hypothetical protein TRG1_729 [Flavobacteriaceae bacterium FS1-H7996/R]